MIHSLKQIEQLQKKPHAVEYVFRPHGGTAEIHRGIPDDSKNAKSNGIARFAIKTAINLNCQ